jgi:replicative DNA helicase
MTDLPKSLINPATEREFVATCIAHTKHASLALEKLSPEKFGEPLFGKVFRAIAELNSHGKDADEFAIDALLSGDQAYDSAGGLRFLVELGSSANPVSPEKAIPGLAESVHSNYLRRWARNTALSATARAEDPLTPIADVVSALREDVTRLEDESESAQRSIAHVSEISRELAPILQRLSDRPGAMLGFSTGFRALDRQSSGFAPGSLTILAARPSMGKTAFALDVALRVAKAEIPVAIFSLETPRDMLQLRLVCRHGRITLSALTSGSADDEMWRALPKAITHVSQLPIYIDDRPRVRASDLRWRVRSAARRFGVKLVIVDYLQLATAKGDSRNEEVSTVSGELQAAARELGHINGGALLVLSQLNRLADGERPRLSHLRDSGAIEQDADAVWFLCEAEGSRPGQVRPFAKEVAIEKSRNGPTGTVGFEYIGQCMAFEELPL